MTEAQIEQRILQLISESPSYTLFLLKQEFKTRQHDKVKTIVSQLEKAGKLHLDENFFIKPGAK